MATEAKAAATSIRQFVWDHLSVALALASATVVLIRALAVSQYEAEIALAVLSSADLGALVIGSVAQLLPVAIPLGLIWADRAALGLKDRGAVLPGGTRFILWLSLLYLGTLLTPVMQLIATVTGVLAGTGAARLRTRKGERVARGSSESLIAGVLLLNVFFLSAYAQPWLPPERLTTTQGERVGYVLGTSDGWVSALTHSPREVIRVRASEVTERQVCALPSQWGLLGSTPLAILRSVLGRDRSVPSCPGE